MVIFVYYSSEIGYYLSIVECNLYLTYLLLLTSDADICIMVRYSFRF